MLCSDGGTIRWIFFSSDSGQVACWPQMEFSGSIRVAYFVNYFMVFESNCGSMEFFSLVWIDLLVNLQRNFQVLVDFCVTDIIVSCLDWVTVRWNFLLGLGSGCEFTSTEILRFFSGFCETKIIPSCSYRVTFRWNFIVDFWLVSGFSSNEIFKFGLGCVSIENIIWCLV